jgi:hypothetical protein
LQTKTLLVEGEIVTLIALLEFLAVLPMSRGQAEILNDLYVKMSSHHINQSIASSHNT